MIAKWLKVEAAGIEPASREVSVPASTRVVDSLCFAVPSPHRHGLGTPSEELVLARDVPHMTPGDPDLSAGPQASPAKPHGPGLS